MVLTVAALCGLSLTLFFIMRHRDPLAGASANSELADSVSAADESEPWSETQYYNQVADEYLALLPSDKVVVARLIDSVNHHILYFEKSDHPSCYIYDLESLTTAVLFGGENGFYCGTKLLITGNIQQWMRKGSTLFFIADNRAPETDYPIAALVFSMDIFTHQLEYIDRGARAYFPDDSHITVIKAKLLYRSFFTAEDHYTEAPVTYELSVAE